MLILPWDVHSVIPTSQSIYNWPGLPCLWTNATGQRRHPDLGNDVLVFDFNPQPPCMMEGLRLTILRCLQFRHEIATPILCATRLPTEEEMMDLRESATHEPLSIRTLTSEGAEIVLIGSGIVGDSGFVDILRESGPIEDLQQGVSLFSEISAPEWELRD